MAFERKSNDPQAVMSMRALGATIDRAEQVRDLVAVGGRLGREPVDLAITSGGAILYSLADVALDRVIARIRRNASFADVQAELEAMVREWVGKVRADAGLDPREPLCGLAEP